MSDEYHEILEDIAKRMDGALENLRHSLAGLRTGRASVSLLDPIKVEVYGSMLPINQLGTISLPESRMLSVQVWDKENVKVVEKAISASGLSLNPLVEGQIIRVAIPDLSEERRKELTKKANEYTELCKIAIRNVRRDGMDIFKQKEKNKEISEDILESYSEKVQKLTDQHITKTDELVKKKNTEIMEI
jgi:ribosome recycling factor